MVLDSDTIKAIFGSCEHIMQVNDDASEAVLISPKRNPPTKMRACKDSPLKVASSELAAPRMVRSGVSTFKNNKSYYYLEHWQEFVDGTLLKKIHHDNGYGGKDLIESGKKPTNELMEAVRLELDEKGYLVSYVEQEKFEYGSL